MKMNPIHEFWLPAERWPEIDFGTRWIGDRSAAKRLSKPTRCNEAHARVAAWLCSPGLCSSRSQRAIPLDAARSLRRRRQLALFFVVSVVQRRLTEES